MSIDIIGNITNRGIKDSMTLEGLVNFIRNPSEAHLGFVNSARQFGKGSVGYDDIKKNNIPCAILNFNHSKGYVRGNTVSKPTGYLYIDVDGNLDIDLSSEHICAYWKSLSGTGYSVVVAVEGLTKKNYKSATVEVSNLLDLPLDKGAISIDRVTCISYDPDAYYNPNAIVYKIKSISDDVKGISQYTTNLSHYMGSILSNTFSDTIRVSTIEDLYIGIDFNGEPVHDFGTVKRAYYDIGFAFNGGKIGSRNTTLYSVVMQLRGMNPWCGKDQMTGFIKYINRKVIFPMLNISEVTQIVNSAYKVPISKVKLKYPKYRRFLYNKDYDLTSKNKRSLAMSKLNNDRVELTNRTLLNCIAVWDYNKNGLITLKKLSEQSGISISPIKKRSKMLKEIIKQKNLGFKNNI